MLINVTQYCLKKYFTYLAQNKVYVQMSYTITTYNGSPQVIKDTSVVH